jgi:hypothetical protein
MSFKNILNEHDKWDAYKHYSCVLQFLWEKYTKANGLAIGGSVGSIILIMQIIVFGFSGKNIPLSNLENITISLLFATLSLSIAALWRFTTQYMMEKEVYGNPELIKWYFTVSEIPPTPWAIDDKKTVFGVKVSDYVETVHKLCPFLVLFLLIISWSFFLFFLHDNINAIVGVVDRTEQ